MPTPFEIALLVFAAMMAGLIDAIAGGGGLITLPALLAVGLPPHLALGTNKGQAVFGAVASATSFWRRNGIDRDRAPLAFVCGLVGSALGAFTLMKTRPEPLRPIVVVLLLAAAIVVFTRRNVTPKPRNLRRPWLALAAIGLGFGFYDGFFGPGVGSMLIVAFALVFGDAITRASGNAKVVNLASNLAAAVILSFGGKVVWPLALAMAGANAIGAGVGARLALRGGDKFVRVVVLLVVLSVVTKLSIDLARASF